jgi:hypothetical protein
VFLLGTAYIFHTAYLREKCIMDPQFNFSAIKMEIDFAMLLKNFQVFSGLSFKEIGREFCISTPSWKTNSYSG